jgi:hypothetical protein
VSAGDASRPVMPPRQRLGRVVRALAHHLPSQLPDLLAHRRFTDGAAALARLAATEHLDAALAAITDDEAAWLADLLLERWGRVAEPALAPEAAIVAPAEVWIGRQPVTVELALVVDGTDSGWDAEWDGATQGADPGHATILLDPGQSIAAVRAHVRARAAGQRLALGAAATIEVRRPKVTVRDDRRRFLVTDQADRPALGVTLAIGDAEYATGPGGLVEIESAAPAGASLRVEGIAVGRIGDDR